MTTSKRTLGTLVGLVALALTVLGVHLSLSAPVPGASNRDALALNGYPPKTVGLTLTVSTGGNVSATAFLALNLLNNTGYGTVTVPLGLSNEVFTLRVIDKRVFINSSNFNAAQHPSWYDVPLSLPDLFGASLELTQPDLNLITGFETSTSHNGSSTTHTFAKKLVAVRSLSSTTTSVGSESLRIRTGSQGEVTGASAQISTVTSSTTLTATIDWYNHHVATTVPPRLEWATVPPALVHLIRGSSVLGAIDIPASLSSLTSVQ